MKIRALFLIAIFSVSILFSSCKEDVIEALPSMSATIDGAAWEATPSLVSGGLYSGYYSFLGYNLSDQKKVVIFVKAEGNTITTGTFDITLSPFDGEGGLQLPSADTYGVYLPNQADDIDNTASNYYSTTGSVIISSVENERIDGTFSFTATNSSLETIQITSGQFTNVKIREITQ